MFIGDDDVYAFVFVFERVSEYGYVLIYDTRLHGVVSSSSGWSSGWARHHVSVPGGWARSGGWAHRIFCSKMRSSMTDLLLLLLLLLERRRIFF